MLFLSSFFLAFFLFYAPIILKLQLIHLNNWQSSLVVHYLFWQKEFKLNEQILTQNKTHAEKHNYPNLYIKPYHLIEKIWHYTKGKYYIKSCQIKCKAGFARPDFTAYSYGFLWAILSTLPPSRQEWLTIDYEPNFQAKTFELTVKGIIYLPFGYLIFILIYSLLLLASEIWQQKRKERESNENRLCRQFNGCSNGKYSTDGRG